MAGKVCEYVGKVSNTNEKCYQIDSKACEKEMKVERHCVRVKDASEYKEAEKDLEKVIKSPGKIVVRRGVTPKKIISTKGAKDSAFLGFATAPVAGLVAAKVGGIVGGVALGASGVGLVAGAAVLGCAALSDSETAVVDDRSD